MFTTFLTVFAGVALLVATFSIYNTFSIIVAQRTRESALLRALGAGRGQILARWWSRRSLVGVVASAVGVVGGLGIAGLLKAMFDAFGFALPAGGLVFRRLGRLIGSSWASSSRSSPAVAPAIKASRVAPLAAIRDVVGRAHGRFRTPCDHRHRADRVRRGGRAECGAQRRRLRARARRTRRAADDRRCRRVRARRCPARERRHSASPLRWLRGVMGSLARQNAMRNPRRTVGHRGRARWSASAS